MHLHHYKDITMTAFQKRSFQNQSEHVSGRLSLSNLCSFSDLLSSAGVLATLTLPSTNVISYSSEFLAEHLRTKFFK